MAQAHDPLPTDSSEAPCAHVCLHMWPMQGLVGPYDPHCRVFAVQMQPVRVGAAPIATQRPKICNLDGPCGVAGSQTRRYAPMRDLRCGLERRSLWCAAQWVVWPTLSHFSVQMLPLRVGAAPASKGG